MTALSFSAGVAVQPLARRLRDMLAGNVAGLCCAAAGAAIFAVLALWTAGYAISLRRVVQGPEGDAIVRWSPGDRNSVSR